MTDLPGVPSDDKYPELGDLVQDFLVAKEEELSQDSQYSGLADDSVLTVLTGGKKRTPMYKLYEDKYLYNIPFVTGKHPIEEGDRLIEYIRDKSNEDIGTNYLQTLYVDAFGIHGGDLHDWEPKIPEINEKIKADIHGLSRERVVQALQGIVCEEGDVIFGDGIRIVHPEKREFYALANLSSSVAGQRDIQPHGIMEFTATKSREEDFTKWESICKQQLALSTLRLYGCRDVDWITTHREPETYKPNIEYTESLEEFRLVDRYIVTPDDTPQLDNLYHLLSDYYDKNEREFQHPVRVALEHFETSISTHTNYSSSITFAIIGLESLFKHYTDGEGGSKFIRRYIAFTLAEAVPHLDVSSVKSNIEDAYGTRNTTVHGEVVESGEEEIQERVWDYLRYSIVIFALLKKEHGEHFPPKIDEALIDEEVRTTLGRILDGLDLSEYLRFYSH